MTNNNAETNHLSLKKNTQFLCYFKIVLLAVFVLLLFLPGTLSVTHDRTNHYSANTLETDIIPISFFEYALADSGFLEESNITVDIEAAVAMFFVVFGFIAVELIFSIVRSAKPTFTRKGKWQLILPVLIFTLFIATCIWYNFDNTNGLKYYEYTYTDIDSSTGEVYTGTETRPESLLKDGLNPSFMHGETYRVIGLKSYTNTLSLSYLFYIEVAILIGMLAIDFYVIVSNSSYKNERETSENTSPKSITQDVLYSFCGTCGMKLDTSNLFCPRCGTKRKNN